MGSPDSLVDRLVGFVRIWIETLTYAFVVVVLTILTSLVLSVVSGGELARANVFVFVIGWMLLAYATFLMWPSSPKDLEEDDPNRRAIGESSRLQSLAQQLPPARWIRPPHPGVRMTPQGKLFVAALAVLAVSFVAETWFGVG